MALAAFEALGGHSGHAATHWAVTVKSVSERLVLVGQGALTEEGCLGKKKKKKKFLEVTSGEQEHVPAETPNL